MSRFSPTVLPTAGPTIADYLLQGVGAYRAEKDRRRGMRREDEADARVAAEEQRRAQQFKTAQEQADYARSQRPNQETLQALQFADMGAVAPTDAAANVALPVDTGLGTMLIAPRNPNDYSRLPNGMVLDRTQTPSARAAREADQNREFQRGLVEARHGFSMEELGANNAARMAQINAESQAALERQRLQMQANLELARIRGQVDRDVAGIRKGGGTPVAQTAADLKAEQGAVDDATAAMRAEALTRPRRSDFGDAMGFETDTAAYGAATRDFNDRMNAARSNVSQHTFSRDSIADRLANPSLPPLVRPGVRAGPQFSATPEQVSGFEAARDKLVSQYQAALDRGVSPAAARKLLDDRMAAIAREFGLVK